MPESHPRKGARLANLSGTESELPTLESLLAHVPGLVYRCRNDPDWTMLLVSAGCRELTGYAPEDLIENRRLSYASLIEPADRKRVWAEVQATLKNGPSFQLNYRLRTATGETRWVWEQGRRVSDGQGGHLLEGCISDVTAQRQTDARLADSERVTRAVLDQAFQFIGLLDVEGRMLKPNRTSLDSINARPEDVEGCFFWDTPWWAHSGEEQVRLKESVARAATGEFLRYETTHPTAAGEVIHMDFSLKPIVDESGRITGLIAEGRDITARKCAEAALRTSEEKFSRAFHASPDAITISDLSSHLFVDCNEGFERMFGYRREEVIGKSSREIGLWADPAARELVSRRVRAEGSVRDFETAGVTRDGSHIECQLSIHPANIAGRPCVITVTRDITKRVQAERSLRKSEEKFAKAFRAGPYALTISHVDTGRYLEVNAGFEEIFGCTREQAIGRTSVELGFWVDLADRDRLIAALNRDGEVRSMETRFKHTDGRTILCRCSCERIELSGQACMLTVIDDVTAEREGERARAELENRLRQAQRLDALGQLSGGIAHDFNNILTGVMAYTELALMEVHRPAEVKKHLTEVRKAGERARDLVKQILAFSRQQQQERKAVRLHTTMREAVKLLRSTLPKTIGLESDIESNAPVVLADLTQIHQVTVNLCTNAAHAMRGKGGRLLITLSTETFEAGQAGRPTGLQPGPHAVITVSDTGHGMNEAVRARIFEPFFTTKPPGEGTGLGLSVVHGIVEDHDGVITVDSRVDEGTAFRLYFPEYVTVEAEQTGAVAALAKGRGQRIMFIDDEKMVADVVHRLLVRLGYACTAFSDPEAAVEAFAEAPQDFDLVFTDLTMPLMTGVEVARRVLEIRPGLPVIMATGYSGSWTAENLRALGIVALVSKPLTPDAMAEAVNKALEGAAGAARA